MALASAAARSRSSGCTIVSQKFGVDVHSAWFVAKHGANIVADEVDALRGGVGLAPRLPHHTGHVGHDFCQPLARRRNRFGYFLELPQCVPCGRHVGGHDHGADDAVLSADWSGRAAQDALFARIQPPRGDDVRRELAAERTGELEILWRQQHPGVGKPDAKPVRER